MSKTIEIKCKGAALMGLPMLHPLQGDLKSLSKDDYEKLKKEILTDGFSFPFCVWENPEDTHWYILDGHQRHRVLTKMSQEGYLIPQLPVVIVQADSLDQAKHKLLAAASQYGKMEDQGLYEFLQGTTMDAEGLVTTFRFADLDLLKFADNFLVDADPLDISQMEGMNTEAGGLPPMLGGNLQVRMVQLFFNEETQVEFLQKINKLMEVNGTQNITDEVLEVVREAFKKLGE